MFGGVSSLKIYGGDFRQINGSYTHHEYNTHVMNYNSNNMMGNTLNETYNDNSQEYHGVNAKGRAYVRALRQEASAQNQIDGTTQPGEPPHSEQSQASEPTPASPDAMPAFQQHVPVQPSPTTFTQAMHSRASSMSCSVAVGDIKKMPSRAADHFLRAFELMDEEDDGEDTQREDSGVTPNLLGVSRQKPVHVGKDEDNSHTASYAVRPDNAQQFISSGHPAVLPPSSQPPTPLHQFSSQKLNPSSSYSHTAHNMRNVITDSITRTSDDAGHSSQSTSTVTLSDGANASHMAVPNAAAVPFSNSANSPFAISQTINESYTEINYNTHTVNHPGSGIVSNNTIQTHHNVLSEGTREKRKRDVEDDVLPKMEEQRRGKRQSKKRTQRPPRRV